MSATRGLGVIARIEIRPAREDGGWIVSAWGLGGVPGLNQGWSASREGAVEGALDWCFECWHAGLEVELAEYDEQWGLALSVRGLRSAEDLARHAERARGIAERAEAAAREAQASAMPTPRGCAPDRPEEDTP